MPPGDNDTGWQNPAHLTCHPHAANSQSPSSLEDPNHNTSNSGPRGWHMACSFQDPQSALWDFVVRFDFSLASSGRGAALLTQRLPLPLPRDSVGGVRPARRILLAREADSAHNPYP